MQANGILRGATVAIALLASASARAQMSEQPSTTTGAEGSIGGTGAIPTRPADEREMVDLPRTVRTLPRAPTLPDLTHTAPEVSIEETVASVKPKGLDPDDPRSERLTSHLFHFDTEVPIGRFVFVGAQYGFAAARSPAEPGAHFVSGQPELFGRVVYRGMSERYVLGAGLAVIAPLITYDDLQDAQRVLPTPTQPAPTTSALVGIVRPWNLSQFLDRRVTAAPWIDLRVGTKKVVLQFRQRLDMAVRSGVASGASAGGPLQDKVGDIEMISVSTIYLGWAPAREVAFGIEAWEVYLLKTTLPISDRDRSVFALSPGVRFTYRWVEPGVSFIFPVGPPLLGSIDSYLGMRVDLRVWLGR